MTSKTQDSTVGESSTRKSKSHLDTLAILMLLGCCLVWGVQQVLVKATIPDVAPLYQATIRFGGAAVLLVLWCLYRGIRLFGRDGSFWPGVLVGLLFSAEFATLYIGLLHGPASRLTMLLYTSPFWVAMLVPMIVPSEKLRPLQWVGLACAFAAVAFALGGGKSAEYPTMWIGDVLALFGGLFWGLTTVTIRGSKSLMRIPAEKLLFYQVMVSVVTLPILSLALGETWTTHFTPFAAISLGLQVVVGAFISFLAWMWMISRYPATKLAVFVFLTPLFALAFGTIWLNEPITPTLIASLVLVAVGIVLVNLRKTQAPSTPD